MLGASAGAVALAGVGGAALRLHRSPQRRSQLSDEHLRTLGAVEGERPRVLFVGNSMILRNDLPGLVARRAAEDGAPIAAATAAANGARLIETLRIGAFRGALGGGKWDVVVLQDFTKTPLRWVDRLGSALAIDAMARLAAPATIVLYPPFPAAEGSSVYRSSGFLSATPEDSADYAQRTEAHYAAIANRHGFRVAPIPARWIASDNPSRYVPDGLHPSEAGSAFIADILWSEIRAALADQQGGER